MIGKWLAASSGAGLNGFFIRHFGLPDFHTHLRLAWLKNYPSLGGATLCELGCGIGIALIELLGRNKQAKAIGFETDAAAVAAASASALRLGLQDRLSLHRQDLIRGLPREIEEADYVLLLDVLEHLPDPASVAAELRARLKQGACLIVSVPTPLYPTVFGEAFHGAIGHLHQGFGLVDLDRLFAGLERGMHRYSTGPLTWPGVVLCYRLLGHSGPGQRGILRRLVRGVANALSLPFRFIDFWNGAAVSCSLFVEYRKTVQRIGASSMRPPTSERCQRGVSVDL